jgi:hypothetical protein
LLHKIGEINKKGATPPMRKSFKAAHIWILGFAIVLFTFTLSGSTSDARDSKFTRAGTGPLYWTSYEYQYEHDSFLPYNRWEANVDWVARIFKPHGFEMVATDGWIEGATMTNEHGYILSHHDSWLPKHPWPEVVKRVNGQGLQMGVYYNPLWVMQSAVKDPTKKVVGTNIRVADIVTAGDFFAGNPDPAKRPYWVDVTKPGAEQFVKGYVNYFKAMNVKFLRIDFLSWYETGTDLNKKVGVNHGAKNYATALRWMSEAAGDDMILSLVMPHLKNHGENEMKYGDMIRINEDVFQGGWEHLSGRRQTPQNVWSQWANTFQGLTGFADIGEPGRIVLDTDFQRIRKFKNDNEKRTSVSLSIMAGAPVAIADQYDTLPVIDYQYYQNDELLALNKLGLVGKPIYKESGPYTIETRDSESWAGKLRNGDWVVGLFNRGDSPRTVQIDFAKQFGLVAPAPVRDLWAKKDLGSLSSYKSTINPHDVKVIRLSVAPARGTKSNNINNTANNQDTLHSQNAPIVHKTIFLKRFGSALLILLAIISLGALYRRWKTFI